MRPAVPAVAASIVFAAQTIHAQTADDAAMRRAFIADAQIASDAGDHEHALDLASRAAALGMSTSLRLFITQEQEAVGRWVDAFANASACLTDAESDTTLREREEITDGCRELLDAARSRVAWLRVRVDAPAESSPTVRINGQSASIEALERPYPCEPGPVILEARANGRTPVRRDVVLGAGETVDVTLALLPLASVEPPATSSVPAPRTRERSIGPYLVAGGGVAALATAGVFFGLRQMAQGSCTLDGHALVCATAMDASRAQSAIAYNAVADVALGVGLAAVAAGVAWWIVDHHETERATPRAAIVPVAGGAVAVVGWRL